MVKLQGSLAYTCIIFGMPESQIQPTNQNPYSKHPHDPTSRASNIRTLTINSIDATVHGTSSTPPFFSCTVSDYFDGEQQTYTRLLHHRSHTNIHRPYTSHCQSSLFSLALYLIALKNITLQCIGNSELIWWCIFELFCTIPRYSIKFVMCFIFIHDRNDILAWQQKHKINANYCDFNYFKCSSASTIDFKVITQDAEVRKTIFQLSPTLR